MSFSGAADVSSSVSNTGNIGTISGSIAAVVVALIAVWGSRRKKQRRRPEAPPLPAVVTAAESAANLNLINLQNMLEKDRTNFERYRDETERSETDFRRQVATELQVLRAELEHRDNIIQQIEEEYGTLQYQYLSVISGVLSKTMPPFPDLPVRRPRPPRPIQNPGTP